MAAVLDSLHANGVNYSVYDSVSIEPTDARQVQLSVIKKVITQSFDDSLEDAISFVRKNNFDGFLAVGGGSVMDTAKAANLYSCHPENEFLDFVNAPIGKGLPVKKTLKPLICG